MDAKTLRDKLLRAADTATRTRDVTVTLAGERITLRVRSMTAAENDRHDAEFIRHTGVGPRAMAVTQCTTDRDGAPLFTVGDAEAVGRLPEAVVAALYAAIRELTFGDEAAEALHLAGKPSAGETVEAEGAACLSGSSGSG